jgi:hypothetical protein
MAITKVYTADDVQNEYFFDFEEAYFKIEKSELRIDFHKEIIKVPVRGYASKTARDSGKANGIFKRVFNIDFPTVDDNINLVDKDSVLAYSYAKIKEHPFFSDGSDI